MRRNTERVYEEVSGLEVIKTDSSVAIALSYEKLTVIGTICLD